MFQVERYQNVNKTEWDNFIKSSKNGLFLFYRDYMDYHSERFVDHSLIIYKKGKIAALFPANEVGSEIQSHGGLTFGGLIMNLDVKADEVLQIFEKFLAYYKSIRFTTIIYKAIPQIFHSYLAQEDLYALFRSNALLFRRDISSVVALDSPIKFSESKKQSVTKCKNKDLVINESNSFQEYWQLLTRVLEKFNVKPVHSLQEIELLKTRFPSQIRLFEARLDGELLAGIVIYEFDKVVHTQYMANSELGRNMGALDFINHELINNKYTDRNYFSFGISTTNNGQVLNTGLIQQKEMMGARAVTIDFYRINL
ncbi:hypothetical protein ACHMWN_06770 [Pedobacter sp. UC225_61]|uniref:hypothetical protein n=1 Tax=Pedobacter sp. UC225_61 TaxID=3374623 RepID=UPI00379AC458